MAPVDAIHDVLATGQVNGTNDVSNVENKNLFKRKRKRDEEEAGEKSTGGAKTKQKKKKRGDVEAAGNTAEQTSIEPGQGEANRKKKRKGKEKAAVDVTDESTLGGSPSIESYLDPELLAQSDQAESGQAAFVSAVVAAASAASNANDSLQAEHHQNLPPSSASSMTPFAQYHAPGASGYPPPPSANPGAAMQPLANQDGAFLDGLQTNEDILRAIQELDLTKLAAMLKVLGDAASAGNITFDLASCLPSQNPVLSSLGQTNETGQVPAFSSAILGQPPKNPPQPPSKKRSTAVTMPLVTGDEDPEHAHILATRWMNASKLADMVKEEGLVYKKGKFSSLEEGAIQQAIEDYRVTHSLTEEELNAIIFAKEKKRDSTFWSEITSRVPQRPIIAVYHHVRRTHHPLKQQGKWLPAEDNSLRNAVAELGQSWEKVSVRVGRMASDCRDRWRNHVANRESRVTGAWSTEEEALLTTIVTEMTIDQGKDCDQDVFWTVVAQKMGNKRGRQQCRIKWTDSLSKTVKNDGYKPRWNQQDAYILVHKIASLNINDDSEIDWKLLSDSDWNLWSAHTLQRRWLTLKRSVKGYEEMTHQEIMDILRVKKAQAPALPAPRKNRVTSAPTISSSTDKGVDDNSFISDSSAKLYNGRMTAAGPSRVDSGGMPQTTQAGEGTLLERSSTSIESRLDGTEQEQEA